MIFELFFIKHHFLFEDFAMSLVTRGFVKLFDLTFGRVNVIFFSLPVVTDCEMNFNNSRSTIPVRLLK